MRNRVRVTCVRYVFIFMHIIDDLLHLPIHILVHIMMHQVKENMFMSMGLKASPPETNSKNTIVDGI